MPEPFNPSALIAMAVALLLSLVALFMLFQRHIDGKPLLAYEPRHRVPWGPLAAAVPLFFLVLSLLSAFSESSKEIDPAKFIASGWFNSAMMLGFVVVAMAFLAAVVDANAMDLGLPASPRQLAGDVNAGMIACVASLAPIYFIQYALHIILQPQQQHELVEQLLEHRSPQMMLVGVMMAVVAAPVFEEFTFRALLQGWLERKEDELLGFKSSRPAQTEPETDADDENLDPLARAPTFSYTNPPVDGEPVKRQEENRLARPLHGMIASLPHGWTPILISSVAFGLAHVGHGVAPIPLVVFGIVLGYLYQRTHRLAASIAAHMLFNAYSMGLLWLQIG